MATKSGSSDNSDESDLNTRIDSNLHPLYMHNNDQPGMILISKKLLGSENYVSWKCSMQIALSAKNKLVIVTGEFLAPNVKSVLFTQWRRVNDMIITWILNTVSEEISNSMNYLDSAQDVWNELSERFSAVSGHKFYETQKELFKLEQSNEYVEMYFHKLKGFWDEIKSLQPMVKCTCGATKEWEAQLEKTKLIQFLMGLHSSYTSARGQLLMMNPWPSVNQAFMSIKHEERQRQSQNISPIAMIVNLPKSHQPQHNTHFQSSRFSDRPAIECTYFHGKNHTKDKCFKLVGYPQDHPYHPNNKGKKRPFAKPTTPGQQSVSLSSVNPKSSHAFQASDYSQEMATPSVQETSNASFSKQMETLQSQMNVLMQNFQRTSNPVQGPQNQFTFGQHNIKGTFFSYTTISANSQNIWVLDTGAINHMCCNPVLMHNIALLSCPLTVKFPTGDSALVTHIGSVYLESVYLVVNDVLYIPSFKFNLLSISKLSLQHKYNIYFTPNKCILQKSADDKQLVLGILVDGLYQLVSDSSTSISCSLSVHKNPPSLWHQRLGHIPFNSLIHIPELEVPRDDHLPHCSVCPLAKQCKLPFPISSSQAANAFDLIHYDVWGPYQTITHSGCRYFLTILDDHTRAL
ncbi:uncharacterized protein LOC141702369 [Apium graveolens]|uniref:uncharacterized protein LOC141702369 n=1 Tax=Apium graveolens TaxID=4045 RepID=UPI003D7B5F92